MNKYLLFLFFSLQSIQSYYINEDIIIFADGKIDYENDDGETSINITRDQVTYTLYSGDKLINRLADLEDASDEFELGIAKEELNWGFYFVSKGGKSTDIYYTNTAITLMMTKFSIMKNDQGYYVCLSDYCVSLVKCEKEEQDILKNIVLVVGGVKKYLKGIDLYNRKQGLMV